MRQSDIQKINESYLKVLRENADPYAGKPDEAILADAGLLKAYKTNKPQQEFEYGSGFTIRPITPDEAKQFCDAVRAGDQDRVDLMLQRITGDPDASEAWREEVLADLFSPPSKRHEEDAEDGGYEDLEQTLEQMINSNADADEIADTLLELLTSDGVINADLFHQAGRAILAGDPNVTEDELDDMSDQDMVDIIIDYYDGSMDLEIVEQPGRPTTVQLAGYND